MTDPHHSDSSSKEAAERLRSDMKILMSDAQTLVGALGEDLDEKAQTAKKRLLETLEESKTRYHETDARIRELGREGIAQTDRVVHQYPYHAMGITFSFGLLLGMLFRKK